MSANVSPDDFWRRTLPRARQLSVVGIKLFVQQHKSDAT